MPPKAKFSKTEITDAALNIVANSGIDALTARSLGEALGSSPRPIFTVFDSMEEVQTQVLKKRNIFIRLWLRKVLKKSCLSKALAWHIFALLACILSFFSCCLCATVSVSQINLRFYRA